MKGSRILFNAIAVGLFAAICVIGMEFLAINIGQPNPLTSDYMVHAVFSDADGLPTAADVRVAGVSVGKVTAISHDPSQPGVSVATLQISSANAVPVYSNGQAVVRPKTLLGEKFVDLTVGSSASGEAIAAGGYLPQSRTSKDVSNDEIFNAFDAKTRQQQQVVLQALDKATQGRAGDIQAILPQLTAVVQDLSPLAKVYEKDNPQVDNIFVQLNTVLQSLADEHEQLAGFLANGNTALAAIAKRDDALIGTLQEYSNVAQEFNTAMAPTVDAQRASLAKLAPTFDKLNRMFNLISGPQPECGNKPCGVDEVFTGTLLGNINYPNDQLTVTKDAGPSITTFWDSMFSNPKLRWDDSGCHMSNFLDSPPSCQHTAQNIVLSFHCDASPTEVVGLLSSIPGFGFGTFTPQQVGGILAAGCAGQPPSAAATHSAYTPTGSVATEAAWLAEYST